MLRLVLTVVAAANFYAAYLFFFTPEFIGVWYTLPPIDSTHRYLTMIVGSLLSVFGFGALIAFFRPVKYGPIIIMLLLMHFMIFVIDVVVVSRGDMPWQAIAPEMIYFLIVSTALVRWYPIREKKPEAKPDVVEATVIEDVKVSEDTSDSQEST